MNSQAIYLLVGHNLWPSTTGQSSNSFELNAAVIGIGRHCVCKLSIHKSETNALHGTPRFVNESGIDRYVKKKQRVLFSCAFHVGIQQQIRIFAYYSIERGRKKHVPPRIQWARRGRKEQS